MGERTVAAFSEVCRARTCGGCVGRLRCDGTLYVCPCLCHDYKAMTIVDRMVKRTEEHLATLPPEEQASRLRKFSEIAKQLGSNGGKVGGPARARSLSAKRRMEIARQAAQARWSRR